MSVSKGIERKLEKKKPIKKLKSIYEDIERKLEKKNTMKGTEIIIKKKEMIVMPILQDFIKKLSLDQSLSVHPAMEVFLKRKCMNLLCRGNNQLSKKFLTLHVTSQLCFMIPVEIPNLMFVKPASKT